MEAVLIADACGQTPAEVIGIGDELTAFAFNAAATVKKLNWNNKRDALRLDALRFIIRQAYCEARGAEAAPPLSFDDDEDSSEDDFSTNENDEPTYNGMTEEEMWKGGKVVGNKVRF